MKYEKWLGAGLGFVVSGSPLGAVIGFGAGKLIEKGEDKHFYSTANTSDFEVNILQLAVAVIHTEKGVTHSEINFVRDFWKAQFGEDFLDEKMNVFNHLLQKNYDTKKACVDLYNASEIATRHQVIYFLFDLAECDKPLSEKEFSMIANIAGWLNINRIDFAKIEQSRRPKVLTVFDILEVKETDSIAHIKSKYRKLVLQFHPDKHPNLSDAERKKMEQKLREIQDAYQEILSLREE
ncbi:MAG TPA: DnaJ domain-containing protein [Chitinophagales bacterium]